MEQNLKLLAIPPPWWTLVALIRQKLKLNPPHWAQTELWAALVTPAMTPCLLLTKVPTRSDPFMPGCFMTVKWGTLLLALLIDLPGNPEITKLSKLFALSFAVVETGHGLFKFKEQNLVVSQAYLPSLVPPVINIIGPPAWCRTLVMVLLKLAILPCILIRNRTILVLLAVKAIRPWTLLLKTLLEPIIYFLALTIEKLRLTYLDPLHRWLCAALVLLSITVRWAPARWPKSADPFIPGCFMTVITPFTHHLLMVL